MSRADKATIWLAAFAFVGITVFGAHRTPFLQLITCPLLLGFLVLICVSIVRIFTGWKTRGMRALIPFAVCIAAVVAMGVAGRIVRRAVFAWALPSYEQVVSDIQSGRINVSDQFDRIPEAEKTARLAYRVFAQRGANGSLFVEILTESGFPVKHSGYLYCSSGEIDDSFLRSRWPITSRMREKWFYVSD